MIIDIGAAKMAGTPGEFDGSVLPNLYGDILSDVAAQIAGGPQLVLEPGWSFDPPALVAHDREATTIPAQLRVDLGRELVRGCRAGGERDESGRHPLVAGLYPHYAVWSQQAANLVRRDPARSGGSFSMK